MTLCRFEVADNLQRTTAGYEYSRCNGLAMADDGEVVDIYVPVLNGGTRLVNNLPPHFEKRSRLEIDCDIITHMWGKDDSTSP